MSREKAQWVESVKRKIREIRKGREREREKEI